MDLDGLLLQHEPAILTLADGSIFHGISIGANGETTGEVVFNTSMTGYQEILTDPSYAEQIITLTYPHIGNVGVNPNDLESDRIWVAGLIIRELSPIVSNWRATQSLADYLKSQNKVAIANIDTRRLTRILREKGAQNGCIITGSKNIEAALQKAKAYPGLKGMDLAKEVSIKKQKAWKEGTVLFNNKNNFKQADYHVVVYDYGVKYQILRILHDQGCKITVVPAETSFEKILTMHPEGILFANGPGDPAACDYAIKCIQKTLEKNIPLFGICLGFQLLALACGAKTFKMKFGHHGANHPVKDLTSGEVAITSQNHSFAVDEKSLPDSLKVTHRSLFDDTLQGIAHKHKPAFAFQGHPEASPGPHDIIYLFDQFIEMIKVSRQAKTTAKNGEVIRSD